VDDVDLLAEAEADLQSIVTQLHTIRYDSVYLTCSKKLTSSQLSLPHGTNKKNKM